MPQQAGGSKEHPTGTRAPVHQPPTAQGPAFAVAEGVRRRLRPSCSRSFIPFCTSCVHCIELVCAPPSIGHSSCRYPQGGVLVEVNAHSLFSKWFSESGKLVSRLFSKIQASGAGGAGAWWGSVRGKLAAPLCTSVWAGITTRLRILYHQPVCSPAACSPFSHPSGGGGRARHARVCAH